MALLDCEQAGQSSGDRRLDGERKFVTVMFVDMAQSARLVIDQDPEDADECLLAALQLMIDGVRRFGGTVNQVLGDGIMALFGAPRAQEDHVLRACLAAEAIHASTRGLVLGAREAKCRGISVRVGICSGEVVIREAQDHLDLKFRATGEAVYKAQRLEAAAPEGMTLLNRATLALAMGVEVSVKPFGWVAMSSAGEPIEALQLTGVSLDRRQFQFLSSEGAGCFVGRSRDQRVLSHCLNEIEQGKGQTLAVSGEAGIGKSRLLFEFMADLRGQHHQVITCSLMPLGAAQPLTPTTQALARLLELQGVNFHGSWSEAVQAFLAGLGVETRHAPAAVLEILGDAVTDPNWLGLDPPQRRQILIDTVAELLCAVSRQRPLIVVFENFQWADSETRLLADSLADKVASESVLMIVIRRSHHEQTWPAWPTVSELEIQPLSPDHTSVLLESLLGHDGELDGVKQRLADKTQGNPFFIEECVRALDESGCLEGSPGNYRLAIPISELKIPATVHGVLAARIDSLPAPERATLLSASVVGERLDVGLLRDLEQLSRDELMVRLSRLQQAGFIERTRIMPNLEYSFRHQLIHDVAYGTLLKRKRRELHTTVLAAVERRRSNQIPGRVELLAHHAVNAGNAAKAVAYCRRAGLRAQERSANREAVRYLDCALEALDRIPASRRNTQRQIDLRLELVRSLLTLGQHDKSYVQLLSAQARAEDIADEVRQVNVASALVPYHWMKGDLDEAVAKCKEALAVARRLQDRKCEIQMSSRLGSIYLNRGDYEAARGLLEFTIESIPHDATHNTLGLLVIASVSSRTTLARTLGELGHFDRAVRIGDEGIRISEETGHVFSQIYANLFVGNALLRKGDFERSMPPLSQSFELCGATRATLLYPLCAASLGYALVRLGDSARGLKLLENAASAAEQHAIKFELSQELTWLGEALLLSGSLEGALFHARRALAYAQTHGEKGGEAWALWLLGEIYFAFESGFQGLAEERLLEARELAVDRRMGPLVAHIDFGLGKIHSDRRNRDDAQKYMMSALSRYRRLKMNYWLKRAESESGVTLGANQAAVPLLPAL